MSRRKRHEAISLGQKIRGLISEGMTITQASEICGISVDLARGYADGLVGGDYENPDPKTVVSLAQAGHSRRSIAKLLKTLPAKVHMILASEALQNNEKKGT